MITDEIQSELFRLRDETYRDFQSKLIPTVDRETAIGVRTPALRKAIQKSVESYRITPEQKEHLRSLRRKAR